MAVAMVDGQSCFYGGSLIRGSLDSYWLLSAARGQLGLKGELEGEANNVAQCLPGSQRGCNSVSSPCSAVNLEAQLCTVLVQVPVPRCVSLIQGSVSQLCGCKAHPGSPAQLYQ